MKEDIKQFKVYKTVISIYFLQMLVNLGTLLCYWLFYRLGFMSYHVYAHSNSGFIGIIAANISYGMWVENKYPGKLELHLKKICIWLVVISTIYTAIIIYGGYPLEFIDFVKHLNKMDNAMFASFLFIFIVFSIYFSNKWFLKWGTRRARKIRIKQEAKFVNNVN